MIRKYTMKDEEQLISEHADLLNFKQSAEKLLSVEQLEDIYEEMNNIPETGLI